MPRCPNCSYMLVLLKERNRYKCAKCSGLFSQKKIEDKDFREQNRRIFMQEMRTVHPMMYRRREFTKNHLEKIKEYYKRYRERKRLGLIMKRIPSTEEERRKKTNVYAIRYYHKNKEKISRKNKEWRRKNVDKVKEYNKKRIELSRLANRKYYKNNRNKVLVMRRRYYSNKNNRDKIMARVKNYKMRNIDKSKLLNRIAWWRQQQKSLAVDYLENIDENALNLNIFDSPPT